MLLFAGTSVAQVFTVLINFGQTGGNPYFVSPAQGRDGRLYGTTLTGGTNGAGTLFVLDPKTGVRLTLHQFDIATGSQPVGGLILGTDGNFYGTTSYGGTGNYGVLFKIAPNGTYTVLHNFSGGTDGVIPASPPLEGFDGDLYGATNGNTTVGVTVYKYTRATGVFTTIYQFAANQFTAAPLIQGMDGNLYGTLNANCGAIFKLTTSGTLLYSYSFPCGAGGAYPIGPLMQAADGNFYGTTQNGGAPNYGTLFKMDQSGVVSVLHTFDSSGPYPDGGLVQASDGNLYGDAWGAPSTLYQITTTGTFTLLHTLTPQEGAGVGAALLNHTNGLFYGTAYAGGAGRNAYGTLFSLDVGLPPFVALVKHQGRAGSLAQILGQGLTGSTSVTFNGVPAKSFHVVSTTYMTAVVPTGATTGPVVVKTPTETLTSNRNFQVVH